MCFSAFWKIVDITGGISESEKVTQSFMHRLQPKQEAGKREPILFLAIFKAV